MSVRLYRAYLTMRGQNGTKFQQKGPKYYTEKEAAQYVEDLDPDSYARNLGVIASVKIRAVERSFSEERGIFWKPID